MPIPWMDCCSVDPTELEARYSTEDSVRFLESILSEEKTEESKKNLEKVRAIMDSLPDREADFVDLYFFNHKTQTDIASIFRVSQPTVCYRLQRATRRIRFILSMPDISPGEMREDFEKFFSDPEDVNIMILMYQDTCQSEVAKKLGITQGKVRHRFMRSLKRMSKDPLMDEYHRIFTSIAKNLNIKREVKRPANESQVAYVVD